MKILFPLSMFFVLLFITTQSYAQATQTIVPKENLQPVNVNGYTYSIGNAIKRTLDRMFPNAENQYSGLSVVKPM